MVKCSTTPRGEVDVLVPRRQSRMYTLNRRAGYPLTLLSGSGMAMGPAYHQAIRLERRKARGQPRIRPKHCTQGRSGGATLDREVREGCVDNVCAHLLREGCRPAPILHHQVCKDTIRGVRGIERHGS